jgi:hypothetical protein
VQQCDLKLTLTPDGGFQRQGQLTPVSTSSGSRSLSPRTPDSRAIGSRGNEFFEPNIANDGDSSFSQQGRRPGGYGGLGQRDEELGSSYSSSPNKQQPSFMSRADAIAPGPFDVGGGGRFGSSPNAFPPRDNLGPTTYGGDRRPSAATIHDFDRRPSMASSNGPELGRGAATPQRPPRENGYGGLGARDRFEPEPPFGALNRAGTFPRYNESMDAPTRTPSAPGTRGDRARPRSKDQSTYLSSADTSRPPPPRKSLVPPRTADHESIDLAAEFGIGNPYHTPTESMSSAATSFTHDSGLSNPSSRSSPPRSETRKPSNTPSIDELMNELQSPMSEQHPPTSRLDASPSLGPGWGGNGGNQSSNSDRLGLRPNGHSPGQPNEPLSELSQANATTRDQDGPRFGQGSRPQQDSVGMFDPNTYGRSVDSHESIPRPRGMSHERQGSASQPSRGICKLCNEEIRGKCISSADGRLTGKYHKACFACTTCREPFTSTEFYVLSDKPYCEPHYHKLNGSLCGSCGKGIEGQYLEDEALVKYHVGCFRCGDCDMSLSNGYFEVDGKAFCERDAWKRAQPAQAGYGAYSDGGLPSPAISASGFSDYMPPRPNMMSPMGPGYNRRVQGSAPPSPAYGRGPPGFMGGLPQRPGQMGPPGARRPPPPGLPRGQRLPPGMGPVSRPRMNKRSTRLGMM